MTDADTPIDLIDLPPRHLAEVRRILNQHAPGCEVRAFGSRVAGRPKPWSDLDLAIIGAAPVGWENIAILSEAFQESDLPFRVDVLDWHTLPPGFRAVIARQYAVIQPPQPALAIDRQKDVSQ